MAFHYAITVRLGKTDAAGVLFFAEALVLCHEAYEALMDEIAYPVSRILDDEPFGLPIVHAAINLSRPVRAGDVVDVEIALERAGETSFTLTHVLRVHEKEVGRGQTVHVCINKVSRQKFALPGDLKSGLQEAAPAA